MQEPERGCPLIRQSKLKEQLNPPLEFYLTPPGNTSPFFIKR